MTITLRVWHLALVGALAILGLGLLLGNMLFREKTVVSVNAPQVDPLTRAKADVRAAVPSAEAYYADHGYYSFMSHASLRAIDTGLAPGIVIGKATPSVYCLQETVSTSRGIAIAYFVGPGGVVAGGSC